ncbi:hypothetical protein CVT24_012420 [Panaeolus cyanescens]|uniref:Uncharacterized protein n=1 Tax=Panaeolus cyanescens TaxID=181874 RepID=A0A409WKD1_9AGAR|nr:hypothetical protein CVT24_012420 [Panaeolus cyanescens]
MHARERVPSSETPSPLRAFLEGGPSPPDIFASLASQLRPFIEAERAQLESKHPSPHPSPLFFPDSMELADLILDEGVMLKRRDPESLQDGESPFVKRDLRSGDRDLKAEQEAQATKLKTLGRKLRSHDKGTPVKLESSPTKPKIRDLKIEQDAGPANRRVLGRMKIEYSPSKPSTPARMTALAPPQRPMRTNQAALMPFPNAWSPTVGTQVAVNLSVIQNDPPSLPASPLIETQPADSDDITDTEESDVEDAKPAVPGAVSVRPGSDRARHAFPCHCGCGQDGGHVRVGHEEGPPPVNAIGNRIDRADAEGAGDAGWEGNGGGEVADVQVAVDERHGGGGLADGDVAVDDAAEVEGHGVGVRDDAAGDAGEVEDHGVGVCDDPAGDAGDRDAPLNGLGEDDEKKPNIKKEAVEALKRKKDDDPDSDSGSNVAVKKSKGSAFSIKLKASGGNVSLKVNFQSDD